MAKNKKVSLFTLFLTMLKIGAFTFGGGYAMIAILESEFVSKRKWIEKEEFLDIVAISESTPGPVAVNMATYIGYNLGGVFASAVATAGVVLPAFLILFSISLFFDAFVSLKYVAYAFKGIQACVVYLILSAGLKMFKSIKKTPVNIIILTAVVLAMLCFSLFSVNFSSIYLILICGALGISIYLISLAKRKKEDKK